MVEQVYRSHDSHRWREALEVQVLQVLLHTKSGMSRLLGPDPKIIRYGSVTLVLGVPNGNYCSRNFVSISFVLAERSPRGYK